MIDWHNNPGIGVLQGAFDLRYLQLTGSLAEVTNHSHTVLTDIGTNTHAQIDSHILATGTSVHGLGSMSTQSSTNVSITGGTISGLTSLGVTGDLTFASGAGRTISVANSGVGVAGYGLTITSGNSGTPGGGGLAGGALTLNTGIGGGTGTGGTMTLTPGAGGPGNGGSTGNVGGAGGVLNLNGGSGGSGGAVGGVANLTGGSASSGLNGADGLAGGNVNITGGTGADGVTASGMGPPAQTGGAGGNLYIVGGVGGSGVNGGANGASGDVILGYTSGGVARGNVGIGNTTPGALLDIGLAGTTLGVIRLEGSTSGYVALQPNAVAGSVTITFPATTGTVALTANKLSAFAATTSAELAGVISDETGSGALVFANTPTLVTPLLGTPTSGTLTNCTGLPAASVVAGTFGTGAYVMDTSLTVPLINGSSADNGDITINGTSSATKTTSYVILQATGGNVGIGTTGPGSLLHLNKSNVGQTTLLKLQNPSALAADTADIDFLITASTSTMGRIGLIRTNTGTDGASDLAFSTYTGSALSEVMRLKANGNVGIGTTGPGALLDIRSTDAEKLHLYQYSTDAVQGVQRFRKARGSADSETIVAANDILGTVVFQGWGGTAYHTGGYISGEVDGTPGSSDMPGRLTFWTTPDESATAVERMRINSVGVLEVARSLYVGSLTGADPGDNNGQLDGCLGVGVAPGTIRLYASEADNADVAKFERTSAWADQAAIAARLTHKSSVDAIDGQGSLLGFAHTDTGVADAPLGYVGAVRSGADNSGRVVLLPTNAGTAVYALHAYPSGAIFIGSGTPADAGAAGEMILDQGAADTAILQLRSSDVAHGMTDLATTDTFCQEVKYSATAGGTRHIGYSEATSALDLVGRGVTDDTTKTTGATSYIVLTVQKKSGTTVAAAGADANLVTINNHGTTRFIFDAEGSAHADVEFVAFDDYNDMALLNALTAEFESRKKDPVKYEFGNFLKEHKQQLQDAKIVNFYDDDSPRGMVNFTRLSMLMVGALRQLGRKINRYDEIFKQLNVDPKLLGETI